MMLRYGRDRRRTVASGVVVTALAAALLGTVPLAFAQEGTGGEEADRSGSEASAFRLGHVSIECSDVATPDVLGEEGSDSSATDGGSAAGRAPSGAGLAVGETQERTYRIVNKGEASYIRLVSRTVLGSLIHTNDHAVMEESPNAIAEAAEDGSASADTLWCFAKDGYWYRSVPLEAGETITIRVSVGIPFEERWIAVLSSGTPSEVKETLDMQALQARNKVIDLSSADPWGEDGMKLGSDSETFSTESEGGR